MLLFNRFSLPLFLTCILISEAKKCPPSDYIHPCFCSEPTTGSDDKLATIYCEGIENLHELRNVVGSSGDYPFPRWTLAGLFFNYVPASALKSKSVQKLHISDSAFVGLFDRVPDANRKLHEIRVERSKILRGVEWELLRNIHNLTELFFHYIPIRSLGKEFQDNVQPSIIDLQLINTNTSKLGDEVFSKLLNIKQITIIDGKITTLKRSMFPKVNIITDLRFDGNLIENLPDDIFSDMPQLKVVSIGYNHLTTLSETTFGILQERKSELQFYGNKIECNCKVRWVSAKGWTPAGDCQAPSEMKGKELHSVGDDLDYCDDS